MLVFMTSPLWFAVGPLHVEGYLQIIKMWVLPISKRLRLEGMLGSRKPV